MLSQFKQQCVRYTYTSISLRVKVHDVARLFETAAGDQQKEAQRQSVFPSLK